MILPFLGKRGEGAENNNGESKRGPEGSFSHILGEKKIIVLIRGFGFCLSFFVIFVCFMYLLFFSLGQPEKKGQGSRVGLG